ncbi:MAG TPA: thioredoxin-like domain-containing protein [Mycobacteriales bacterium]|nr:thioredoxin-like domain-containing protein [Mycobacteriales bacterium]
MRIGPRVRAPELQGRSWLNTGGRELSLAELRGRCVILDFWTFCCVNCLHVLDELRPLENDLSDVLTVVGVHSPKFTHEADPDALAAAVDRYEITHPVLDDPDLLTWQQYAVRAWPTLVVIDPQGYVVAQAAGEGHVESLGRLVTELAAEHNLTGTPWRAADHQPPAGPADLRFPGKLTVLPGGTLLVSDTRQHRLVELAADGRTVLRRIGSGTRGLADGTAGQARFSEPQGVCVLPAEVAGEVGYDVVVADTVNHALRGVTLADGSVRTVASAPRGTALSPWDVAWWSDAVAVAAAGTHQIWRFDPRRGGFEVLAGTTTEGLRDGPAATAWFAQPSGLAADGDRLWVADAEASALRYLRAGTVHTAVGQGLFDFGHRDGPAASALFQHPLGVAMLPDGSVAVCDTYNDAVRRYRPDGGPHGGSVDTLATGVAEPSGAAVVGDDLVVVASAEHRLVRLPYRAGPAGAAGATGSQVAGAARQTRRPATDLAPGQVSLDVVFEPAAGQKLDDRYGPATLVTVSASPPELLLAGAGESTDLSRRLVLADTVPAGVLHVTAQAASCDTDAQHPACHLTRQDWGVPVRVVPGATARLGLVLRGMDDPP